MCLFYTVGDFLRSRKKEKSASSNSSFSLTPRRQTVIISGGGGCTKERGEGKRAIAVWEPPFCKGIEGK